MHLLIVASLTALVVLLFAALLSCLELGYRVGRSRIEKNPNVVAGAGVIEAAVFGLLGLLLAFQFAASQERMQFRRNLIVREANAIGTAYLRIDLLPAESQPPIRELLRKYVDTRIATFESLPDVHLYEQTLADGGVLQSKIWSAVVAAAMSDPNPATRQLTVSALNDMIDITTDRMIATANHVPAAIIGLLLLVSMLGAMLAGHAMAVRRKGRSVLHATAFSVVIAATLCVLVDLEYPRYGLVRNTDADRAMHDARAAMK